MISLGGGRLSCGPWTKCTSASRQLHTRNLNWVQTQMLMNGLR